MNGLHECSDFVNWEKSLVVHENADQNCAKMLGARTFCHEVGVLNFVRSRGWIDNVVFIASHEAKFHD